MKRNQVAFVVVAIIALFVVGGVFYFRKDISGIVVPPKEQPTSVTTKFDIQNIPCPILTSECAKATIFTSNMKNISFVQIGYYNDPNTVPIFAVFDGTLSLQSLQFNNEKGILIDNGQYEAVYRFLGDVPSNIKNGNIKKGTIIGVLNKRLSYFEKKYNFAFGIWDLKTNKPRAIEFNQNKISFRIL